MLKQAAYIFLLYYFCYNVWADTSGKNINKDLILLADISIGQSEEQFSIKKPQKKSKPELIIKNKPLKYEISGYIKHNRYVRALVEIDKNNLLNGYLFIEDKPAEFVYGRLENGSLYMYDTHGELFTILVSKKTTK